MSFLHFYLFLQLFGHPRSIFRVLTEYRSPFFWVLYELIRTHQSPREQIDIWRVPKRRGNGTLQTHGIHSGDVQIAVQNVRSETKVCSSLCRSCGEMFI
jgi:hypothetical protein